MVHEVSFLDPDTLSKRGTLTPRLNDLEPGRLLLFGDKAAAVAPSSTAELAPRPDYLVGRDDSLNRVRFADLTLSTKGGKLTTQPVAIKPLARTYLASQECRTAHAINQIAPRTTFQPVGFMRTSDGGASLLTAFEQGVVSFDNTLWSAERPSPQQIEWALGCAAASLIFLHANGYRHGDFQVKNTAYDLSLASRIIDVTSTKKATNPPAFQEDISLYISSLTRNKTRASYASEAQVREYFLDEYSQAVVDIFPRSQQQAMTKALAVLAFRLSDILTARR